MASPGISWIEQVEVGASVLMINIAKQVILDSQVHSLTYHFISPAGVPVCQADDLTRDPP